MPPEDRRRGLYGEKKACVCMCVCVFVRVCAIDEKKARILYMPKRYIDIYPYIHTYIHTSLILSPKPLKECKQSKPKP